MKRLTSLAMLLILTVACAFSQQITPLALKQDVKTGKLPNGLTYYILHNEKPENRANFYIAQKVGSSLENPEQLGLAHFLEHMAFNGTTHYPGKDMLNYLQSKGIRFGADINAYTAFDQTVYNINNVITTDKPLMDSVLLVIRDWCDGILLQEDEIEAERGVINEEWRSRNSASSRMYESILPKVFQEYQYQQMPIGKMDVVMNFKPEVLRAYYKKWYRPDLQGIVIVGDFDADEMERKVKDLFSNVVMPENAAPREYVAISDNKEPIVALFQDPELPSTTVMTFFKSDKTPWEMRNSVEGYMGDVLMPRILQIMIQNRLKEYGMTPECPYAAAQVHFGDFLVAATKDALTVYVVPKSEVIPAYEAAMGIVARACKTGFTPSELERANAEVLSSYENLFNEKDKTDNNAYGTELIDHFIENTASPGIEVELQLAKQLLPNLPVNMYNMVAQQLLTPENQVIVVSQPLKESVSIVKEDEIVAALQGALNATYEAYVDEVITDPLIANLPKPGKITATKKNDAMGTTEFTLSNGAKAILKTTDFKADEILMAAFRKGGKQSYSKEQAPEVLMLEDAISLSKIGDFDVVKRQKYLAGKNVEIDFSPGAYTDVINGNASVKDFPTLMELLYASMTELNPDPTTYHSQIDKIIPIFEAQEQLPQFVFSQNLSKTIYGGNPLMAQINSDVLKKANYEKMLEMAKAATANAADYTFIFVGNVDEATLRPLLEQYVASLPSKGKATPAKVVTPIAPVDGKVENRFEKPMESPSTFVYNMYSGSNVKWDVKNSIMVDLMGDVLDMIFVETLREDEGGTYGASVGATLNFATGKWQLSYNYKTAAEKLERMESRADKELLDLLKNGAKSDHFNKVKEAAIKQYEIKSKTNGYWTGAIMYAERGFNSYEGYIDALRNLTLDEFNKFLKSVYNGKNEIEVIMIGTQAEK